MNTCPDCGAHVVWLNSPIWRKLYGDPRRYLRELQGEDLKPRSPFEVEIVRVFGTRGEFQNVTQQKATRALIRKFPVEYLSTMLTWAAGKNFTAWERGCLNTNNFANWQKKQEDDTPAWMRLGRGLG